MLSRAVRDQSRPIGWGGALNEHRDEVIPAGHLDGERFHKGHLDLVAASPLLQSQTRVRVKTPIVTWVAVIIPLRGHIQVERAARRQNTRSLQEGQPEHVVML